MKEREREMRRAHPVLFLYFIDFSESSRCGSVLHRGSLHVRVSAHSTMSHTRVHARLCTMSAFARACIGRVRLCVHQYAHVRICVESSVPKEIKFILSNNVIFYILGRFNYNMSYTNTFDENLVK